MAWKVGASRGLPIVERSGWDDGPVRARVFKWAGWPDNPQPSKARRAFLVYNTDDPELKGSYKLSFADVVNGRLVAISSGLRAAASRLPQTNIPEDVRARARAVLDRYFARMKKKKEKAMSNVLYRTFGPDVVRLDLPEGEKKSYRAVINTGRLDRYHSVIKPEGIRYDDFLRYGSVLFNHDPNRVIGRAVDVRQENGSLVAEFVFDEEDEFALEVKRKVDRGFLRGTSVGIRVLEWDRDSDGVMVIKESDLVEFSVVSTPANPDALIMNNFFMRQLELVEEKKLEQAVRKLGRRILDLSERLDDIERRLASIVRRDENPSHKERDLQGDPEEIDPEELKRIVKETILKQLGRL